MTVYEILNPLTGAGSRSASPTVYRARAARLKAGHVRRFEPFTAHKCDHGDDASVLTICDDCRLVGEREDVRVMEHLTVITSKTDFRARRHVVEVHGFCNSCAA